MKVGLTAADRDRDRLLEQGAITCTLLAAGPYPPIRLAEHRISIAKLAAERLAARAKATAWWQLPPAPERARQMRSARQRITAQMTWPSGLELLADTVTDQAGDFGLDEPVPGSYREVASLGSEPELAGTIRFIVGRRVLLDTASGPLLADMRRFAGWTITASAARTADGLGTVTRTQPEDRHDRQDTLFLPLRRATRLSGAADRAGRDAWGGQDNHRPAHRRHRVQFSASTRPAAGRRSRSLITPPPATTPPTRPTGCGRQPRPAPALAHGRPVVCDRDWLSSLAYAYSIAGSDGSRLFRARAAWAAACLDDGTLLLPGSYLIFDLDAAASLHRRARRLKDGHPWSLPGPLRRLQDFYADPVAAVADAHPGLGATVHRARWQHVCGHDDPQHQFQAIRDLAGYR